MELSVVLRAHLARSEVVDDVEVEPVLAELVREATVAWPDVRLAPETFVARIAHHCSTDVRAWLREVRGPDLYLATACAERVPGATEALERNRNVPALLARGGMRHA